MTRSISILALLGSITLAAGCAQGDFPAPALDVLSEPTWSGGLIECTTDDDCDDLEACVNGTCRLKGCHAGLEDAPPPLGLERYVAIEREPVVIDGSSIRQFDSGSTTFSVGHSWSLTKSALDLAGGKLYDDQEAIAVILEGQREVAILSATETNSMSLSFVPTAIAAGDVDADGTDEIIVSGSAGQLVACEASSGSCTDAPFTPDGTVLDVAVGDVDGDSTGEVLVLVDTDPQTVVVWNVANEGETPAFELTPGYGPGQSSAVTLDRIAAGDLNGDGLAEVVGVHERWLVADEIYVLSIGQQGMPVEAEFSISGMTLNLWDVAVSDLSADGRDDVLVVTDKESVLVFKVATTGAALNTLAEAYEASLPGVGSTSRISMLDFDGDCPIGRLVDGPIQVNGQVRPVAVMTFPPFSRTYSDGVAGVSLGAGTSESYSSSESMSVNHGPSLGISASAGASTSFGPKVINGSVDVTASGSLHWAWGTAHTVSKSKSVSVGRTSFSFGAFVENYGTEYAGVVVEAGCYTAYVYEIESTLTSSEAIATEDMNGETLVVLTPVGGQMTLWSSGRYNAMARALEYLPEVDVPFQIGNPSSYPASMVTLDGESVRPEQLLFPHPRTYRTSDLGQVGWSMSATESETNSSSSSASFSASGSVTITASASGGVNLFFLEAKAHASVSASAGYSYSRTESESASMTIGRGVSFSGYIPSIPDNPRTAEDEHSLYGYAFTPYIYQQEYTDPSGQLGAYWVLMYMVQP